MKVIIRSVTILSGCLLMWYCTPDNSGLSMEEYQAEIMKWRQQRLDDLKSEDGYLSLVGLYWLEMGSNTFGSHSDNDHVFPEKAPERIGTYYWLGDTIRLIINEGVSVTMDGAPVSEVLYYKDHFPVLNHGSFAWRLIKRGYKIGLRLRDYEAESRRNFQGFEYFPIDLKWRIKADFIPYNPQKTFYVKNIFGMDVEYKSPGKLVFQVDGKEYNLDVFDEFGKNFLIMADETSAAETYGAGRFFYVDDPDENGKTIVDFNKAYNPPCAYNDFTTCPLPPPQNYLALRITAGEKDFKNNNSHQSH